ncbi:MAG TPA: hypothetical protein VFK05_22440 [Polyangiaceae bacterium]|nr:hypothetical protein [Polyangiaceae bacterium]
MRGTWVVVLSLVFGQGCSSSYEPARSPRIVTVIEGGQPTFVKDGERVGSTTFGAGLVDAVQGNPEAEHHATVGRNLTVGGLVLSVVGLGAAVGGIVVVAQDAAATSNQHSSAGSALLLGGAVAMLVGSVVMLCGQPHIYDAVNIYNDGLDAASKPAPPGPRASYTSRRSLH